MKSAPFTVWVLTEGSLHVFNPSADRCCWGLYTIVALLLMLRSMLSIPENMEHPEASWMEGDPHRTKHLSWIIDRKGNGELTPNYKEADCRCGE